MKIEIKLDNPKYCNGCPLFDPNYEPCIGDCVLPGIRIYDDWDNGKIPRPQECIDLHDQKDHANVKATIESVVAGMRAALGGPYPLIVHAINQWIAELEKGLGE